MSKQPKALELAAVMECLSATQRNSDNAASHAAAELRRQHALIVELLEALVLMVRTHDEPAETLLQEAREQQWIAKARAVIARAAGEQQ